jgi:hypothetical protein
MSKNTNGIEDLQAELSALKHELLAMKGGYAVALASISVALREIPGYEPTAMERMLTHALKYGWPLQQIPDNEVNEIAFTAPLRFLLNDQKDNRELFRTDPHQPD